VTEFLAKWVGAAFLLSFAWSRHKVDRKRALGLVLAALALLAFEVGWQESLLELACTALLVLEVRRLPSGSGRRAAWIGAVIPGAALLYFAVRPWAAAALRALS
jgi:hypothetical protein